MTLDSHPSPANVLVVDDKDNIRTLLCDQLDSAGFRAESARSAEDGLEACARGHFDVVITDVKMPGMSGIELLRRLKVDQPEIEVIVITAFADMEDAIKAMKLGASDYIRKPFKLDEIEAAVWRALKTSRLQLENRLLKEEAEDRFGSSGIVAESKGMRDALDLAKKIARGTAPVLITGETGVGKELVARAIHRNGPRADRSFIPVNCAALPESLQESALFGHVKGAFTGAGANKRGYFEEAAGGVLLLDEIGEISAGLQVKLLRALQNGEYTRLGETVPRRSDARLIAATNRNLRELVDAGIFRKDLYYRLNVLQVHIPPLRERTEDIPSLIERFLQRYARELKRGNLSAPPDLTAALTKYSWPGNIRELQNAMERAVLMCPGSLLRLEDLPAEIREAVRQNSSEAAPPTQNPRTDGGTEEIRLELPENCTSIRDHLPGLMELAERRLIEKALAVSGGNRDRAAKILGISRRSLFYKLKAYGMKSGEAEEDG